MKKRKSIKENYIYNLIFQILSLLLPFITTPYISRVLQPENVGIYSYTYSIVSTCILFGSLGTAVYGQREIAIAGEDRKKISELFWEIFYLKVITMTIAIACFIVIAVNSSKYQVAYLIQIPFFIGAIFDISWLYQGLEDFKYVALRNTVIKIISVMLIFLLVRNTNDLIKYLLIMGSAQVVGDIPMWSRLKEEVEFTKPDIGNLKKHLKGTFVYFVPAIATQIYSVLDKTMLGTIGGIEAENGYYEQANKIISMTVSVVSSYTIVMRSRISYLFGNGENIVTIKNEINKTLKFICFLVFPMAFGMAGIASNFVPWFFGNTYKNVTLLLYIFSPMYIFLGIDTCLGTNVLLPIGQQNKSSVGQIAGAIINFCLNAYLIPKFYSVGAAIASVITEFSIFLILLFFSRKYVSVTQLMRISFKYFFSGIIMFLVIFRVSKYLSPSVLNTCVLIALGMLVYLIEMYITKDEFIKMIVDSMKEKILKKKN